MDSSAECEDADSSMDSEDPPREEKEPETLRRLERTNKEEYHQIDTVCSTRKCTRFLGKF